MCSSVKHSISKKLKYPKSSRYTNFFYYSKITIHFSIVSISISSITIQFYFFFKKYKRCWRGKLGRIKFQNRSKWIAKKKHDREELARRKATRIQSMVRGRKERRAQRSRRDKKNAAVRLQAYARGRKDRLIKIPKLKENARKRLLLEMAAWRSDPRNNLQTLYYE